MEYICPNCKNPNFDEDALLCLYCGESLHRPTKTTLGLIKSNKLKLLILVLIAVVIVGFLLLQL